MTENEKDQIITYRKQGYGYSQISNLIGISKNSIKSFCKRHGLGGTVAYEASAPEPTEESVCEQCGKPVRQNPGRKLKRFCSDKCRMKWWNTHQDQVKRKANYNYTCACCGKAFMAYGNSTRKYCSHECYIEDRFGGAR